MFDSIANSFSNLFSKLRGKPKITQKEIEEFCGQKIKEILLEADVSLSAVEKITTAIKEKAVNQNLFGGISPEQALVKLTHDEIHAALRSGEETHLLSLNPRGLSVIMMVGLQGSGKTTTSAKLATMLKKQSKKVMLASIDVYRPAAIEQLRVLSQAAGVAFFDSGLTSAIERAKDAFEKAQKEMLDVLIIDTAGRIQVDNAMMEEAANVKQLTSPCETLLVMDSLMGQDAARVAQTFHEVIGISGGVLTRADADNKGGAALSFRYATTKPIKFLGVGEKITELEVFDPERIAGRILGMGDIVSLVEKAKEAIDKEEAEKAAEKLKKGQFGIPEYMSQLQNLKKMGGLSQIMKLLPANLAGGLNQKANALGLSEKQIKAHEAIICSMHRKEKNRPDILNMSRKNRIARGAGVKVDEVNKFLKQFFHMQTMFKKASQMNISDLLSKTGLDKLFS